MATVTTGAGGAAPRWNLFARTLEELVNAHGEPLSRLDNLIERAEHRLANERPPQPLVHRESLRRLRQSLSLPGTFTVLNPDEMERIVRYFEFNDMERRQLSVALLANAIQRLIYDRLSDKQGSEKQKRWATAQALRIVEGMLPALGVAFDTVGDDDEAAFREDHPSQRAQNTLEAMSMSTRYANPSDEQVYTALGEALDAVDRATLALQLSRSAKVSAERLAQARAARAAYSDALADLDEQAQQIRASSIWQAWHDEARHGYAEADERVIDLGG